MMAELFFLAFLSRSFVGLGAVFHPIFRQTLFQKEKLRIRKNTNVFFLKERPLSPNRIFLPARGYWNG
jgi:hypothetical protein